MNWNITRDVQPEDNTPCVTLSEGGIEQNLTFYKGLWFYPDMSMYVYYTPRYWRAL